jgi:ubiquinone/menaquinone biosynthesis C-methylase UbiE
MQELITTVQQYWDTYSSRLEVPGKTWGSREFFAKIKSEHDKVYAYANEILNLANLKGRCLLELGCGIGLDTVEFARCGADVTAIDLSPTCIELAKRLMLYYNLDSTVEVGNAEKLKYPSNSFDIVVARGLLMFTPNDSRVLSEILRVLRPGGEVNILLHNRLSWYVFLAKISRTNLVDEVKDPPVNRLYSIREVQEMLAKFSSYKIFFDRFPSKTKRMGILAQIYNQGFVSLAQIFPSVVIRPIGFYIIIKAIK